MTKYEEFAQDVFDAGIVIEEMALDAQFKAFCSFDDKYIVMNKNAISDNRDKYCTLVHEVVHFEKRFFFNLNSYDKMRVAEEERAVNIETARRLVPEDLMFKMIFEEKKSLWQIADELDVTNEIVEFAFEQYEILEKWSMMKSRCMTNEC